MRRMLILSLILFLSLPSFNFCSKEATPVVIHEITFNKSAATIFEDIPDGIANISVSLSEASNKQLLVAYQTMDSTAIDGSDYQATSGTLIFEPGEQTQEIKVNLLHNASNTQNSCFTIHLSSAFNTNFQPGDLVVEIMNVDYGTLVWSDEFNDTVVSTTNWNYELGNNNGWGNQELESYTNSTQNARTEGGSLIITAIKATGNTYTSARLTTKGKREFTYGKVIIRGMLPEGHGIWPALWMLGANISSVGWPKCGEIDIMELLGQQPDRVYATVHYDNNGHKQSGNSYSLSTGKFSDAYHTFTFLWQPNRLTWYIDDEQYFSVTRNGIIGFPMDLPEFFIFNVAVGGLWPGNPDATTVFPQTMKVDYIRVYQ